MCNSDVVFICSTRSFFARSKDSTKVISQRDLSCCSIRDRPSGRATSPHFKRPAFLKGKPDCAHMSTNEVVSEGYGHWNRHATRDTRKRNLRSKFWWLTEFCNSHYVSHFAAFFIVARAKISVAVSCKIFWFRLLKSKFCCNKFGLYEMGL